MQGSPQAHDADASNCEYANQRFHNQQLYSQQLSPTSPRNKAYFSSEKSMSKLCDLPSGGVAGGVAANAFSHEGVTSEPVSASLQLCVCCFCGCRNGRVRV